MVYIFLLPFCLSFLCQILEEFDCLAVFGQLHDGLFALRGIALGATLSFEFSSDVDGVYLFDFNAEDFFHRFFDFYFVGVNRYLENVFFVGDFAVTFFAEHRSFNDIVLFHSAKASSMFLTASAVIMIVALETTS